MYVCTVGMNFWSSTMVNLICSRSKNRQYPNNSITYIETNACHDDCEPRLYGNVILLFYVEIL